MSIIPKKLNSYILQASLWYNNYKSGYTQHRYRFQILNNIKNLKLQCKNGCRLASFHKNGAGYITMFSVLVLGAVGLTIVISLVFLGLGSSLTSFSLEQSSQAKNLANACAEEGLQQIRNSSTYTGTGILSLGQGSCSYNVTSQGGQNRAINAIGTVGIVVRKVKVIINQIDPAIQVVSWQEVADL